MLMLSRRRYRAESMWALAAAALPPSGALAIRAGSRCVTLRAWHNSSACALVPCKQPGPVSRLAVMAFDFQAQIGPLGEKHSALGSQASVSPFHIILAHHPGHATTVMISATTQRELLGVWWLRIDWPTACGCLSAHAYMRSCVGLGEKQLWRRLIAFSTHDTTMQISKAAVMIGFSQGDLHGMQQAVGLQTSSAASSGSKVVWLLWPSADRMRCSMRSRWAAMLRHS